MDGASFAKTLNAESLSVGADLFMRDGATFHGDVLMHGARVGGTVNLRHASFDGTMSADLLIVGGGLYIGGLRIHVWR
jgi:hypothetical protein